MPRRSSLVVLLLAALLVAAGGAGARAKKDKAKAPETRNPEDLQIVDCLLPGQVRRLGTQQTYISRRRPIRTTALDCGIRGGEYVAYDRADYKTALKVWLETAESGDPQAQYYVGEIYQKGLGTDPDYEEAARWYRKAADQGHGPAQIALGFLYEKGLGVPVDTRQALGWYRKAAGVSGVILLDSEVEAIRQELADAAARLEEARAASEALEGELTEAREELDRERASGQAETAALEERVASLEGKLEDGRRKIRQLEEERSRYDVAGPSIEIVDRSSVRSLTPVDAGLSGGEIVGRVEAPAGLASFHADGRNVPVDDDGFFRFRPDAERLTLVAIDRQGKRGELVYSLDEEGEEGPGAGRSITRTKVKFGDYHALLIGNSDYDLLPRIEAADEDVASLADLLQERYGFSVTLLRNATYLDVLAAFSTLREELGEKDNLLVYYAGHGELDETTGVGYWLPVDAAPDRRTNWISSREVSLQLDLLPPRHILVVADSCYSAALTRSSLARFDAADPEERGRWIRELVGKRSRTALTSGGLQPVLDAGGGGHSIFARALLEELGAATDTLETYRLWSAVKARVMFETRSLRYEQIPEYAPIQYAGHESGEFFFVPVSG